jgi:hypothetical protein
MSAKVKNRIIKKINHIEDESFLIELENIIEQLQIDAHEPISLTDEMQASINLSNEDIRLGRTEPHETIMKKMREWLKEK